MSQKKEEVERFKSAKFASQIHPELLSVMSPNSFALYQLCDYLKLESPLARLGVNWALIHSNSVEMVKKAYNSFDQATLLAMISPNLQEESIEDESEE